MRTLSLCVALLALPGLAAAQPATSADVAAVTKEVHGVHNDIVYQNGLTGVKLDALHTDMQALLKALQTAPSTSVATPAAPATADVLTSTYFPTDPGLAAFPSPENSTTLRLGAAISGRPYLRDTAGNIHQLVAATSAVPNGYLVNGNPAHGGGSDGSPATKIIVRQGNVYVTVSGGQTQLFNFAQAGLYNAALPDAFTTDATGATTSTVAVSSVVAPTPAARATVAPGSSGKTLSVCASGCAYATLTAAIGVAANGDTIDLAAGTYNEAPPAIGVAVKIVWETGAILDLTGLTDKLAHGKGGIVPMTDILLVNPVITGTALDQGSAQGTAAIRAETGCNYIDVQGGELYKNQNGVAGGDVPVVLTMTGTYLHDNGLGDGYTHNIYMSNGTLKVVLTNVRSLNPNGGHGLKDRAFDTVVTGGEFESFAAAAVDVPQGSVSAAVFDGVTFTKKAGAYNHTVLDYATENTNSGNGGMTIKNSTFNINCDNPVIMVGGGSVVTITASTFTGTKPTALGGKVAGL